MSTTDLEIKSGLEMSDEPDVIMEHLNIDKFNKIIKSLRQSNLFLIKLMNEEEEQIEKQKAKASVKFDKYQAQIEMVQENAGVLDAKLQTQLGKYDFLKSNFGDMIQTQTQTNMDKTNMSMSAILDSQEQRARQIFDEMLTNKDLDFLQEHWNPHDTARDSKVYFGATNKKD